MGFGIYSTIAGANARNIELEVIANNIANVNTVGFKEVRPSFNAELQGNEESGDESQVLVSHSGNHIDFAPGQVFPTGNELDVAIQGDGFFEVQTPQGVRYTRSGNFVVNSERVLCTPAGHPLASQDGNITVPNTGRVTFSPSGEISVNGEHVGSLKLVSFKNTQPFQLEGGNLFNHNGAEGAGSKKFKLVQGYLEASNVNVIANMARMIEVSRAYESHQKSISKQMKAAEMLQQIAKIN